MFTSNGSPAGRQAPSNSRAAHAGVRPELVDAGPEHQQPPARGHGHGRRGGVIEALLQAEQDRASHPRARGVEALRQDLQPGDVEVAPDHGEPVVMEDRHGAERLAALVVFTRNSGPRGWPEALKRRAQTSGFSLSRPSIQVTMNLPDTGSTAMRGIVLAPAALRADHEGPAPGRSEAVEPLGQDPERDAAATLQQRMNPPAGSAATSGPNAGLHRLVIDGEGVAQRLPERVEAAELDPRPLGPPQVTMKSPGPRTATRGLPLKSIPEKSSILISPVTGVPEAS